MRLTEVLKGLFESDGGEVWVGGVRIDGLVMSNDDVVKISTISSLANDIDVGITVSSHSAYPGDVIRMYATYDVDFDEYTWSIVSGDATFIDGVTNGTSVAVTSNSINPVTISLEATKGDLVKSVETIVDFVTGFFGDDAAIVGPSLIDFTDPVRYEVTSEVEPDDIVWSVVGGGSIEVSDTDSSVAFVTADDSGDDIIVQATLSRDNYNSKTISKSIDVDKCELSSGTVAVERPAVIYPEQWSYDSQPKIRISPFHGESTPGNTAFQLIPTTDGDWESPLWNETVEFTTEIPISMDWFIEDYSTYFIRVQYIDDQGRRSEWSDPAMIQVDVKTGTGSIHILDVFGDGSCVASLPLDMDSHDVGGDHNGVWTGTQDYSPAIVGYGANLDGSSKIMLDNKEDFANADMAMSFYVYLRSDISYSDPRAIVNILARAVGSGNSLNSGINVVMKNDNLYVTQFVKDSESFTDELGNEGDSYGVYTLTPIDRDRWVHCCVVLRNGNEQIVYLDGQRANSVTSSQSIGFNDMSNEHVSIGNHSEKTDDYYWFIGGISKVRIFSRSLTAEEVAVLRDEGYPTQGGDVDPFGDSSGVALWSLNGNALDSGNNYNGSWSGTELYDYGRVGLFAAKTNTSEATSLSVPAISFSQESFTLSFCVNFQDTGDYNGLFLGARDSGIAKSYLWFKFGTGEFTITDTNENAITISHSPIAGEFIHYAVVNDYTNNTIKLYVNGTEEVAYNGAIESYRIDDLLGAYSDSYHKGFNALLGRIRVFREALDYNKVQSLYYEKDELEFARNPDPFYNTTGYSLYLLENNTNDELKLHDAVWGQGEQYTSGPIEGEVAARFDGDGWIVLHDKAFYTFTDIFTFSCWVSLDNDDAGGVILSLGASTGRNVYIVYVGSVHQYLEEGVDYTVPYYGDYYHLCVVKDSGTSYIYINGEINASGDIDLDLPSEQYTYIGSDFSDDQEPSGELHGASVAKIRFFNNALDAGMVKRIYDREKPE